VSKEIQKKILELLPQRSEWEQRQRIWYEMLRDGLRRRNKPYPGAANLHLPIADNAVEKLKPYYINAVFGRHLLASFTPLHREDASTATAAAEGLDWKLRKESNYPKEFGYLTHLMLGCGRVVMKCRWERRKGGNGRLAFQAIDPLFFIGQPEHDTPDEMDYFCHVRQMSVERYKRTPGMDQSPDLLELIKGGEKQVDQWKGQEKEIREGLTGSAKDNQIVLWETWERTVNGWVVRTFSPCAPDKPVRRPFRWDLEWQGDPLQPFVTFQHELTEKGWYAPRGVVEKVASFESYGTKIWNQKADWLDYASKPLFTRSENAAIGNTLNFELKPGQALPPGLTPAAMPPPPISLDEEINSIRAMAEEAVQLPDFGVTPEGDKKESRTATEMQYIGSFASQGIQHRSFINGLFEGEIYKRAWAYLVKFGGEELVYFSAQSRKVLPKQAMHDNYLVEPDATPDGWDRGMRAKRSVARYQMFKGHPNVEQGELVKTVLEDDDPRLVKRLYVDTGSKAANEAEDEAIEIGILLEGFPAAANPGEDHPTRLRILFGKLQQQSMMPPPSTPEEAQRMAIGIKRMHEHIAAHMKLLQQENPAMAKQFSSAIGMVDPGAAGPRPGPAPSPGGMPPAEMGMGIDREMQMEGAI